MTKSKNGEAHKFRIRLKQMNLRKRGKIYNNC